MAPRVSGGRGKFELGQRSAINITPLVGVMLLLLLVFMTAAPTPPRSITIDNVPGCCDTNSDRVFINVEKGRKLYIGARPTTLGSLVTDVAAASGGRNPSDEFLMVRAARDIPYGDFMLVMSTLKHAGYNVGMIAEDL